MFRALDKPNEEGKRDGTIDWTEFKQLIDVVMQYKLSTTYPYSSLTLKLRDRSWYQKFRQFVVTKEDEDGGDGTVDVASNQVDLDYLMNYVLVANFILVVVETFYDLSDLDTPACLDNLELIFSFVYVFQFILKISVMSFQEYWQITSNRFDFFTTWLLLFAGLVERIWGGEIATYANVFRLMRLLRMVRNLRQFPQFQNMISILFTMVKKSTDMMVFLMTVVFFFTMLSVQVFGGEMREENSALQETEYLEQHFMILNCNDVPLAFGVWVVMLLQEYQPIFADATAQLKVYPYIGGYSVWWMLFPAFYILGVSIAFELLKAFTIQVYAAYKTEQDEKKSGKTQPSATGIETLDSIKSLFVKEGQKLHTKVICDNAELSKIHKELANLKKGF
jgi:hypothetical protein